MKTGKWYKYIFAAIMILIGILTIMSDKVDTGDNGKFEYEHLTLLKTGWYYNDAELDKVPCDIKTEKGEWVSISRTFDEVCVNAALCFRTDHTYVRVYADGDLIYTFGNQDNIPFGKTPGSLWNIIEIDEKYEDKEITIETMCPYDKYSGHFRDIVYGNKSDIYLYIIRDSLPLYIMCMLILAAGVLAVILSLAGYIYAKKVHFLPIGIFLINTAIWGFTESRTLQLWFGNIYAIQMVNFLTFAFIPMTSWTAIMSISFYKESEKYKMVCLFDGIVFIVICVLQYFEIADFFETLTLIHLVIVVFGVMLYIDIRKTIKNSKDKLGNVILVSAFISTTCFSILDIIEFYTWDTLGNGVLFRLGLILFIGLLGIWYVRNAFMVYTEKIEYKTLKKLAFTDALTGLKNRRALEENMEEILKFEKCLVIFIDLNNLKLINDSMGHEYGDNAIIAAASMIKSLNSAYSFRLGGDEFCVILDEYNIQNIKEQMEEINEHLLKESSVFTAEISIAYGYAEYIRKNGDALKDIINTADQNMYENKVRMKLSRDSR